MIAEGVVNKKDISEAENHYTQALTRAYMTSKEESFNVSDWKAKPWEVVGSLIPSGNF